VSRGGRQGSNEKERRGKTVVQKYSEEIEKQMKSFYGNLSEKEKRRYAAIEVDKLGHGGQKYICSLLQCSPTTVRVGREEWLHGSSIPKESVRRSGGGRKKIREKIMGIDEMFLEIIKDNTAGSPMDEKVRWTNLGLKAISRAFKEKGYEVSEYVVKQLLKKHKYVKRKMKKTKTVKETAERNEQFEKIKELRDKYIKDGNIVISIDVKKKEVIGIFYHEGRWYCTESLEVYDHDFHSSAEAVLVPHGIYDIRRNKGYMTLGMSHDTSEFGCDCLKNWWETYGKSLYPGATSILILADGGGSNSSRHHIFKEDLQKLANEIGIEIRMAHYPPYTSKYNPIEHRMFCHVTRACAGTIFTSAEMVKGLIDKTSTSKGLKVFTCITDKVYKTARKVQEAFKKNMPIVSDEYLGKWNYRAIPQV
jgi:hypothetical protein